jgi:hypothetical protein
MSYLFVLKEEIVLKLQSYKDNSIELCWLCIIRAYMYMLQIRTN